jgi:FKBP-type peptidyl-prolyl cis-trans isomerase SlpA
MKVAEKNNIAVHYTGKLKDGEVFDSSEGREPLKFIVGDGNMIPGFEKGVLGMQINEKKTIEIPFDQAYGDIRKDLFHEVSNENLPQDLKPEIGMQLQSKSQDGSVLNVTIIKVNENSVTIDANHPLAGKDLYFDIEVVEIN